MGVHLCSLYLLTCPPWGWWNKSHDCVLLLQVLPQGIYEEFKCRNRYIHFYQFEIFAIKAAEKKKKIGHMFHHNFKNIPCYVTSEVSLQMFYIALFDDRLTLKLWNCCISVFAFKIFILLVHTHTYAHTHTHTNLNKLLYIVTIPYLLITRTSMT